MRILHFTNIPFNIEQIQTSGQELTTSGGWMVALINQMLQATDDDFVCAAFANVSTVQSYHENRIECVTMPKRNEQRSLQLCQDLINKCKPDLIHIHGTEGIYGLLTAYDMINTPAIISLQGLLGPCSEWYNYFGNRSLKNIIMMHRYLEIPILRGQWMEFRRIRKKAKRERKITKRNHFFIGRTTWDRAYISSLNPAAQYFHGGEILREDFWKRRWEIKKIKRHRIIFTNAGHPRKGTELLLDAAKLLQADFPNIKIYIAGSISRRSGYGRYIRKQILESCGVAVELGQLNSKQMVNEMVKSHIFVSPSFIDNSPNAVCEAQLLGMPIVSTYTGGVPSLIVDGLSGLFSPTGDAPMMAARIRQIFDNDPLAINLGEQSHDTACQRHAPDAVIKQILFAYKEVSKSYIQKTIT